MKQQAITQSTNSATLADVLERILDKGLVIAGDIKIKLVDIELLTIQIRLMIASVEKAKELGMDWWVTNKDFSSQLNTGQGTDELETLKKRIEILESQQKR
ncbi:MAG: gas vesicle protein [Candidatus Brocadiaceae bacterium]